jgi:hypothetical protein
MTTPLSASAAAPAERVQRRFRNFLLDAPLQLKFAAWVVAATVLVAAVLGAFLVRQSSLLFAEMEQAVEARSGAVEASKELGHAVLAGKLLERYEDPAFAQQLEAESAAIDRQYEQERAAILLQRSELVLRQRLTLWGLAAALVALVAAVGLASIVATHRIAGPVFRLKRMTRDICAGALKVPDRKLRDSDELKEVFELFGQMVHSLRESEQGTLDELVRLRQLGAELGAPAEVLAGLRQLEETRRARLC